MSLEQMPLEQVIEQMSFEQMSLEQMTVDQKMLLLVVIWLKYKNKHLCEQR